MNRLYEQGFISNPVGKAKSVLLTDQGLQESERLFSKLFVKAALLFRLHRPLGRSTALLPSEPEFPAEHLRHKPFVDDQRADTLAHLFVPTKVLRSSHRVRVRGPGVTPIR
jgi:hypothetical protein